MTAPLSRALPSCLFPAALFALASLRADGPAAKPTGKLDFNRDVRPILSDNCFACHGPDAKQRKAKLRLDTRDEAAVKHGDAIVPGKPAESELIRALVTDRRRAS